MTFLKNSTLAMSDTSGSIYIIKIENTLDVPVESIIQSDSVFTSLAFSYDEHLLAASCDDKTVKIYDVKNNHALTKILNTIHTESISFIEFS